MLCHTGVTVAVSILVLLADLSSAQGRSWHSIYMNMNIVRFLISTTVSGIMHYWIFWQLLLASADLIGNLRLRILFSQTSLQPSLHFCPANDVQTRWLPWLLSACIPSCVKPYLCTTAVVRSCRTSSNVFFFLFCSLVTASSNSPVVLVSHLQSDIGLHVISYFAMGCTDITHLACSLFCFSVANDKGNHSSFSLLISWYIL